MAPQYALQKVLDWILTDNTVKDVSVVRVVSLGNLEYTQDGTEKFAKLEKLDNVSGLSPHSASCKRSY